jgi:hypothetical protein
MKLRIAIFVNAGLLIGYASSAQAQQKGQYVPGQFGLNAGVAPPPGFTYINMPISYSADELKDSQGDRVPGITGDYSFWVDENIFMYVTKYKVLGADYAPFVMVNLANGSLVADIVGTNLGTSAGGSGFADTFVQPLNLGWHLTRADITAGYAFVAPTGRFTQRATDNVGSGYGGNLLTGGGTYYLTENKVTSANVFAGWETHGHKRDTDIRPGQAFTDEWGFGQALPLTKDKSQLIQIGLIGYDQWQVSESVGTLGPVDVSGIPFYSVHAIGIQTNYVVPSKNVALFFKYEDEYRAQAHPMGRTIVFGGSWMVHKAGTTTPQP